MVECYTDSSTYRVHLVPFSEQRALQLKKKALLSYLLWPILGFLISFLFSVHIQVKIVLKEDKFYSGHTHKCHFAVMMEKGVQWGYFLPPRCAPSVLSLHCCNRNSAMCVALHAVLDLPSSSLIASMSSSFSLDNSFLISSRISCFSLS